ncbi:hypothetical protein JCM1841_002808 [Sporobolomyces salmonicolor]
MLRSRSTTGMSVFSLVVDDALRFMKGKLKDRFLSFDDSLPEEMDGVIDRVAGTVADPRSGGNIDDSGGLPSPSDAERSRVPTSPAPRSCCAAAAIQPSSLEEDCRTGWSVVEATGWKPMLAIEDDVEERLEAIEGVRCARRDAEGEAVGERRGKVLSLQEGGDWGGSGTIAGKA